MGGQSSARDWQRPTIRDVARRASVSPATVSNVLTGRCRVDPDVAGRVLATIDALGYRRDIAASALRSGQRTVVGALVPELGNPFFGELVDRLEREASLAGRRLLIATSGGDPAEEARQIAALGAWRPAGVIAVPCDGRFAAGNMLERQGIPFVVLDRPLDDNGRVDTVAVDNVEAARVGTARLIELGHRLLLVVASSTALGNIRERVAGVDAAVAGVDGARAQLIEAGFNLGEIAAAVAAQLGRVPRPTALFTLNNVLTLGALKAIAALGLVIPDDVSLLGFDDYDWMEAFQPPLSAVRQPVAELAQAAWQRLAELTGAAPMPGTPPLCHVRLRCSLAWRGSVAAPRTSAPARQPHQAMPAP
jgi:DNA-binding LacI/PurR family transcriptional regulator